MKFSENLLNWYAVNKRELPWRASDNPYVIWITEVVFQQTRISQGLPFYYKFIEKFPTVEELASAEEVDVLKMWQGLGYYSRARNLHFSAKYVVNELNGVFPNSYKELLKLKGVGPYIAAEIASVCFGEVTPAVDGNVHRVISRYFGVELPVNSTDGAKEIYALANEHISKSQPGDFNQALMDYGSMVCSPKLPLCETCVFVSSCWAFSKGKQGELPVKLKKAKSVHRFFNYTMVINDNKLAVRQRPAGDIWQGLFEPVLHESKKELVDLTDLPFIGDGYLLRASKRILSHQTLHIKFWVIEDGSDFEIGEVYNWYSKAEILDLPVPKSVEELFSSPEFMELFN